MEYILKYTGDPSAIEYPIEVLNDRYAIAELDAGQAERLLRNPQVEFLEPSKRVYPVCPAGVPASAPSDSRGPYLALDGSGVAVGIVDSGIDVTHTAFQTADGRSRILSLWDMSADGAAGRGRRGRIYSQADIEAGEVDSQDTLGHGTAVAGVAAGSEGIAPGASLIVAKMGSGRSNSADIMRGVKYIIDEAQRLNLPCAVNLSYGTNLGAHRGQSLFEGYLNDMTQRWRNVIVCATGNEGFGGHHFHGTVEAGGTVQADFAVAQNVSSLYLVLWNNFVDEITLELVLPNGTSTGAIHFQDGKAEFQIAGVTIQAFYGAPTHYRADREILFQIRCSGGASTGHWMVLCHGVDIVDGRIDLWLPTIEEVGTETAFLEPDVNLTATLPSTAERLLAVGGYRMETDTISAFSGRGVQSSLCGVLPDLVAPAENIRAPRAGGGYAIFSGTSLAAPFVTGTAALMMQWGIVQGNDPMLYDQRVRAFLHKNARRASFRTYPDSSWGYGALDIPATIGSLSDNAQNRSVIYEAFD